MSYNQDIIYAAIGSHPGATLKELASMLDINKISVHRALTSLGKAKMIRFEVVGYSGMRKYWVI